MTIFFRKISFYLSIFGICGLVFIVHSLSKSPPMPEPPIAPASKGGMMAIAASGLVEARNENTSIGVPVPALVKEVKVQVWDKVEKGDVLMQLDDTDLKAQLLGQEAQLKVASASLKRLEDQLQRLKGVTTAGAVTADEIATRSNDVAVSKAQVESAQATLAQTNLLIGRLTIRAPITGTILQINTRVGEYAAVNGKEAPIIMGQIEELQVRADIDEQLAPRVRENVHATAYVKGDTGNAIELKFERIEPFIVPKVSLTGSSSERVDTRVLQVIFSMKADSVRKVYVGQQMDIFLKETTADKAPPAPKASPVS